MQKENKDNKDNKEKSENRIYQLRKKMRLSERKLGEELNCSQGVIRRAEEHKVPNTQAAMLAEFARFFGVTTDYLLYLTDDPNGYSQLRFDPARIAKSLSPRALNLWLEVGVCMLDDVFRIEMQKPWGRRQEGKTDD